MNVDGNLCCDAAGEEAGRDESASSATEEPAERVSCR